MRGYPGGHKPLLADTFASTRFVAWDGESVTIPPDPEHVQALEEELWRLGAEIDSLKETIATDPLADAWRTRRRGERIADFHGLDPETWRHRLDQHGAMRGQLAEARRQRRHLDMDLERARISTHSYVLLMSSAGHQLVNPVRLSTAECLNLLCDAAAEQPKHTINVAFGGNYDVVKILADLGFERTRLLWTRPLIEVGDRRIVRQVYWREKPSAHDPDPLWFRIEYTPRSCLRVARQHPERWMRTGAGALMLGSTGHPRKRWGPTFTLWDVMKFFQTTFVRAVEEWLGRVPELEIVRAGKVRRSGFTAEELDGEIIPYTRMEVELLVRVMDRLRDALCESRIPIARWDGVGAIAAALMTREGIQAHMPRAGVRGEDRHLETLPPAVQEAAQHAYAGGRIEAAKFGRIPGPIFHKDINSAYPAVYPSLPSLAADAGRWVHQGPRDPREPRAPFSVSRMRWHPSRSMPTATVFPFFFRDPLGNISFPASWGNPLEGWYWEPEVAAAVELSGLHLELLETWEWQEHDPSVRPFSYVGALFDRRMEVGKRSGEGRVLKLGLNAHSGKTAQSAGWRQHGHVPSFHVTPWAGYITSSTRAQLYRAAMQAPENVIAISTDGIWSLSDLDVPVSTRLGEWESAVHDELVLVQSGVYWTRDGDEWKVHCRGYDLEDFRTGEPALSRDQVLDAWRAGLRSLPVPSTRFIGFGSALAGPRQWARLGTFWTATRWLALTPTGTKRAVRRGVAARPWEGPVSTVPVDLGFSPGMASRKYPLGWHGEEWGAGDRIDGVPWMVAVSELEDAVL